jgi:hypothetical protein
MQASHTLHWPDERIAFGAYFLWLFVLAALLCVGGQTRGTLYRVAGAAAAVRAGQ